MNFQQLLGSWSQSGTAVTIDATTAPSLAAFLGQFYSQQGSQISIHNATITQDSQAQRVQVSGSGSAGFLTIASAALTATLFLDDSGNLVIALTYLVLSPTAPTGWKFSASFPNLPMTPASASGGAPGPALLDTLPLVSAQFVVTSAAYTDPISGAAVPAGISFQGQVQPAGLIGVLSGRIPTAPVPLTGTIVIPPNPASIPVPVVPNTQNIGATQAYPWDVTPPLPGIQLVAPLGQGLSLGQASLTNLAYLIYSPTANNWPADPLLQPVAAVTGTLASQSAGISATAFVSADPDRPATAALVEVRLQGVSLANLASLSDLAGSSASKLPGSFVPVSLASTVAALSCFGLTELSLQIASGDTGLVLEAVSITVGAPGCGWSVWGNGQIQVANLALNFTLLTPMGDSSDIMAELAGTATIAGAAVDIMASPDTDGGLMVLASLQDQVTLPLSSLVSSYLTSVTGIAAPSDLTIDTLRAEISSAGLEIGGSMATQQEKPWTLEIGPTSLQVSNVTFDLVVQSSQAASGTFGGTIALGGVTLTMSQSVPGPLKLQATCPTINLSALISSLTSGAPFLPTGFDLVLTSPSILIDLTTSTPSFQVAAQVPDLGTVAFEVAKVNGTWGFVSGIALTGQMSALPGLSALSALESILSLDSLEVIVASVVPPSFRFPDLAVFNNPALGSVSFGTPTAGLVAGLNVYGNLNMGRSAGLSVVQNLLGLSPSTVLGVAVQVGQNPLQNSSLLASIAGNINSSVALTGTLAVQLQNGAASLSISGSVTLPIQGQSCLFSIRMLVSLSPPGAFLSGTMQGSVSFSGITLSNLALQIGVDSAGLPSLGVAATVTVGKFNGSVAVFLDSVNPASSLLAGSIGDLTLKDVADTLAGIAGFTVPASMNGALAQIQVSGTQTFTLPQSAAADLSANNAAQVAASFQGAGLTLPADPKQLLIVSAASPGTWFVTDLSTMRHYSLVQGASGIRGSLDTQLYVAPQATQLGALRYQQGFFLNGKLSFFGFSLSATVQVSNSQGLRIDAEMSPLTLYNSSFFCLTGAGGQGGPRLSVSTYDQPSQSDPSLRPPHLLISAQLVLLGCTENLYVSIGNSGLAFSATFTNPAVSWTVAGSFTSVQNMSASGAITVGLQGLPPLDFGALGRVSLNTSLSGNLAIAYAGSTASISLTGSAVLLGQTFSIGTQTLNVDATTLSGLPPLVANALKPLVQNFLSDVNQWLGGAKSGLLQGISGAAQIGQVLATTFKQSGKQIGQLTQSVLGYAASDIAAALNGAAIADATAANILKNLGYGATDVGSALKSVWGDTDATAASLLQNVGYGVTDIGSAVKATWHDTDAMATSLLQHLGYSAADVGSALKTVWNDTDVAAASLLKNVGYAAADVGSALKTAWKDTDDAAASILKSVGYGASEVGSALKTVWKDTDAATARVMRGVGYGVTEVGNALKTVWNDTDAAAASVLKGAGYVVTDVGNALKLVWGDTDAAAASVLKGAGYIAADVGSALNVVWGDAAAAAASILHGAGYAAADVGSALKTVWSDTDVAAASILRGAGYAAADVGSALKTVWADTNVAAASALRQAGYWVNNVGLALQTVWGEGDAVAAGVLKAAGYWANDVASALKGVWGDTDAVAAGILKGAGFNANDVGGALMTMWSDTDAAATSILKGLSFSATEVGVALKSVWGDSDAAAASILKQVGYGATDIATALSVAWSDTDAMATAILKNLGYTATDVGSALNSWWHDTDAVAAGILKGASYPATDVANALKTAWNDTDTAVAGLLKGVGYSVTDIGTALKAGWNDTDATAAGILKGLSYSASDVGSALKAGWADTDSTAAGILKAAGYSATDVGAALKSVWGDTDSTAASALKAAGYSATDIANTVKSLWGDSGNQVSSILYGLGYDGNTINSAIKSAYGSVHVDTSFGHGDSTAHFDTPHTDGAHIDGAHIDKHTFLGHVDTHDDTHLDVKHGDSSSHIDTGTHIDA